MLLLLIHMQGLQDDLSESQSPLHVQREHSTPDSNTRGPVCLYCEKHLLTPTATTCAGCGHLHRASIKLTPKESITASEHNVQETNHPSSGIDTQDKQSKYPTVFGAYSSAQVLSLPAGTQCSSRNQEASSETSDDILKRKRNSSSDGTNEQLIKHIRTDDMSDPGAAVSDGKNESSKSPETKALNPSQDSDVGCIVYMHGCSRNIISFIIG